MAYADTLVAGGLPHVLDGATYTNLAAIRDGAVDTPTETAGSADIFVMKLDPKWSLARFRFFAQDGAGSADNDTATIQIATYPCTVQAADDTAPTALRSMQAQAVLTWGTLNLASQTKDPFTRSALSGSVTIREADAATLTAQYGGPVITHGYAADNGGGEIIIGLEFASYLAFTWVARSNTDTGRVIAGVQLEV